MSRFRYLVQTLAVILLLTWALSTPSHADPLAAMLERPLLRFMLLHTEQGALLSTRILGFRASDDAALRHFAKKLSDPQWTSERTAILERLEHAELQLRARLHQPLAPGEILPEVGELSARWLGMRAPGKNGAIIFTSEFPPASFRSERARFLDEPATASIAKPGADLSGQDLSVVNLAGQDLRFTRWKGTRTGNLTQADLRGADLKGMKLTRESLFEGAYYDQFTSLPFTRREAAKRGMQYRASQPPESYAFVNVEVARAVVKGASRKLTIDIPEASARIMKNLWSAAPKQIKGVEFFNEPKHIRTRSQRETSFEIGKVTQAPDDPLLADLIEELGKNGGELRRLVSADLMDGKVLNRSGAYFSFDGQTPKISVGAETDSSVLVHEREHFRDWMKLYRIQLSGGLSPNEAFAAAQKVHGTAQYRAMTERHAIRAELREQARLDELAGKPLAERHGRHESRKFAYVASYPELEALGVMFRKRALIEITSSPVLRVQAEGYARRILHNVLSAHRTRYLKLGMKSAADFTGEELFHEVVAGNAARFAESSSLDDIRALFDELLPSEIARLRDDAFRQAIEPRFPDFHLQLMGD